MSSDIFFTSDQHFNHENIIRFCKRPFSNAKEMNEALVEYHNSLVKPHDIVYHLGDFVFGHEANIFFEQLNGKKVIIEGNHDRGWIKEKPSAKAKIINIFRYPTILESTEFALKAYHTVLCHYPMMSWNRSFHGAFHLHGHTHNTIPFDNVNRRLDVGVDANLDHPYHPFAWEDIVKKLSKIPTPREQQELRNKANNDV